MLAEEMAECEARITGICERYVPEGVITCPSCARHLEKKMNAMDQPKHDRSGHY